MRRSSFDAKLTPLRHLYRKDMEFFHSFYSSIINVWKDERQVRKFADARLVEKNGFAVIDSGGFLMDLYAYLCVSTEPVLPLPWFSISGAAKGKFLILLLASCKNVYFYAGSSGYYAKIALYNAYSDVVSGKVIRRRQKLLYLRMPQHEIDYARTILRMPTYLLPAMEKVMDFANSGNSE